MSPLTKTFGCVLISMLLTFILYGMVLVLGAQYFRSYSSDPMTMKITIASFLAVGTIHVVSGFMWIYQSLIDNFGLVLRLDLIPITALLQMGSIFFLSFFSQCFFGTRIWILSKKNLFMTAPIFAVAIVQFTLAILALIRVGIDGHLSAIYKVKGIIIIQDTLTVVDDLLITAELCYLLHRNRSGIRATDSLITRLLIAALNRGIITSIMAALSLAMYLYSPTTMIFEVPTNTIGQVYILSVLSMLHSRKSLRNRFSRRSHTLSSDNPIPHTPASESFNLSKSNRSKATLRAAKNKLESSIDRSDLDTIELELGGVHRTRGTPSDVVIDITWGGDVNSTSYGHTGT